MSISFPENWLELSYPNLRSDLLLFLKELSDVEYQKPKQVSMQDTAYDRFDIDEIFHFFFDDTDLGLNPEGCIGKILFNNEEVNFISSVTSLLNEILEDLGDRDNQAYISHPFWVRVIETAKLALKHLSTKGVPSIT